MKKTEYLLRSKDRVLDTLRSPKQYTSAGFTIIELLVATLVFSMVLLLIAVGVLQFNHAYYSGITQADTQNTARAILEDVTQAIQFSGTSVTSPIGSTQSGQYTVDGFCIGNERYSYVLGWQLVSGSADATQHQTTHALIKDDPGNCGGMSAQDFSKPLTGDSTELLSPDMRLSKLSVSLVSGSTDLYKVDVRVVYGDDDLLTSPATGSSTACEVGSSSQFCAVSELSTVVQKRIQ